MICPVIKGECICAYVVGDKQYCELNGHEIHKGSECPEDEEEA